MIGKVIKYTFDNDANLFSLFAGRVFPMVGAQKESTPFCVYEISTVTPESSKDSDSHIDVVNVRMTISAENYGDCQSGVEYIRTAFVRQSVTVSGVNVQSCSFDGQRDVYSDDERNFGSQCELEFRIIRS